MPKHHTVNTFRDLELKFLPVCSLERSEIYESVARPWNHQEIPDFAMNRISNVHAKNSDILRIS